MAGDATQYEVPCSISSRAKIYSKAPNCIFLKTDKTFPVKKNKYNKYKQVRNIREKTTTGIMIKIKRRWENISD